MRLDFVSDVARPWCAVGLHSLERALEILGQAIPVNTHLQPFELNPGMGGRGRRSRRLPEEPVRHGRRATGAEPRRHPRDLRAPGAVRKEKCCLQNLSFAGCGHSQRVRTPGKLLNPG